MALHQSNPVDTLYDIHRNFPIIEEIDSIKNILNTLELHSRHYEVLSVDTTGPTFWIAVIGIILRIMVIRDINTKGRPQTVSRIFQPEIYSLKNI